MNFFSLIKRNFLYKFKKKILIDADEIHEKSLDKLFQIYGSDKTGIQGHGYSSFYTSHLEDFKNKKINILEIGSYAGAQLV